ncbi:MULTISPECIES: hypothetical protein [unclassified Crossiella]|uniref:hypothetical protein n=1 Tax=unclassified Crossiella TaxID=2620835 RepID=UPI001FFFB6AB|nr:MULTISPECIES: hypothetical protein [unclassified Crossiella]MCK2237852.1 hypothetical protein [Crossiella sp. S99.2]MCK2255138.1 hypothetical protein [Crossiella sp. S99.1]
MRDSYDIRGVHGTNVNIGPGQQYVAGRDQHIGPGHELLTEIQSLRRALDDLRLTGAERREADRALDEVAQELQSPQPDRSRIATQTNRLTTLLQRAGALATAGAALLTPLGALTAWLGF